MNYRKGVNSLDPPVGQLKIGNIVGYNSNNNTFSVQLNETTMVKGTRPLPVIVPISFPLSDSNGLFIGSLPAKNTPIVVGQGASNQHHFVSFKPENLDIIPNLDLGELLVYSTESSYISLDLNSNINIGSDNNKIHILAGSDQFPKTNLITFNLENENHFTQAYREVGGLIKRDKKPNPKASSFDGNTKLEDDSYDPRFFVIGMDPTTSPNDLTAGPTKNPPLTEHREIVYEFQYNSAIDDDVSESKKYSTNNTSSPTIFSTPNRRQSRADTLSLSLVSPNFLMEEVKGTVVDIFGNILDLNRTPLPLGQDATTTVNPKISTNQSQSFLNIKALERKSIAYHFEVNARKDPNPNLQGTDLSITADNYNAKLQRSRFHFDIDKEGQIKLNIPASSDQGNIPLQVRYENYSTFGTDDNNNPNKLWIQNGMPDIFLDSFAAAPQDSVFSGRQEGTGHGSIALDNDGATGGPIDRLTNTHMQHGTVHHDILQTCILQQENSTILYPTGAVDNVDVSYITPLSNIVSPTIPIGFFSGVAGGRSGAINMDGSLEWNIGANTLDRQSLWLDTAGGMVWNIGRDKNSRSAIMNFDGDLIMQVGGFGVSGDARFVGQDGTYNAVLDLRVFNGGKAHLIRIDSLGIVIMTPGRLGIHAGQGLTLSSDSDIVIDCENLTMQGRPVMKYIGGSI